MTGCAFSAAYGLRPLAVVPALAPQLAPVIQAPASMSKRCVSQLGVLLRTVNHVTLSEVLAVDVVEFASDVP